MATSGKMARREASHCLLFLWEDFGEEPRNRYNEGKCPEFNQTGQIVKKKIIRNGRSRFVDGPRAAPTIAPIHQDTMDGCWCREGESNPQDPKVGGF